MTQQIAQAGESSTLAFRAECLRRAQLLGEWIIANQEQDIFDANYGRFIDHYHPTETWPNGKHLFLTGSMMTAMGVNLLLMLSDRAGERKYLDAAVRCGEYIKALQYLNPRKPEHYGTFGEFTQQMLTSRWPMCFCYRSTTVAADGLVLLYARTGQQEYLDRAIIFADWFLKYAVSEEGWVPEHWGGSMVRYYFEMGNVLFFAHLYRHVQDPRYLELMRRMCEFYLKHFLTEDGSPAGVLEKEFFENSTAGNQFVRRWWRQHLYNDDFSGVSMIAASRLLGEPRYLEPVQRYASWLVSKQNAEGGFGEPSVWVGSATVPILLLDLDRAQGTSVYDAICRRSLMHLMTLQEMNASADPRLRWAIYENNEIENAVSVRTCCYGGVALLKYEGAVAGPYLSGTDNGDE